MLGGSLTQSLRCTYDGWSTRENMSSACVSLQVNGAARGPSQAAAGVGSSSYRYSLGHSHGVHMLPSDRGGRGRGTSGA